MLYSNRNLLLVHERSPAFVHALKEAEAPKMYLNFKLKQ